MITDLFQYNLLAFLPDLIILLGAFVILLISSFTEKKENSLGILATFIILISLFILFTVSQIPKVVNFKQMIIYDPFSYLAKGIILTASLIISLLSINYLKSAKYRLGDFYSLLLFSIFGMCLLASVNDLIMLFIGIEILSISIYILVGQSRNIFSSEASLKYFLMGGFTSAFIIYGISMIYGGTGSTNLFEISFRIKEESIFNGVFLIIGVLFLLVGIGFKTALVPFHMWVPDVYQGSPLTITSFMSVGVKATAFFLFIKLFAYTFVSIKSSYLIFILWWISVLSMIVGNILALMQDNIKRLLAYSSIAHAGYLLIGIISGTNDGNSGIIFYLLSYIFMNLGAFGPIIILSNANEEQDMIENYAGVGYTYPFLGIIFTISLLSLAGIPPTAGFFAKFYIFKSAILEGHLLLVIIAIISSMISLYFYIKIIVYMYMYKPIKELPKIEESFPSKIATSLCLIGTIYLGIVPQKFLEVIKDAIEQIPKMF